jgi:dUTP pyrophosphatase
MILLLCYTHYMNAPINISYTGSCAPQYASITAAGADLIADIDSPYTLAPGQRVLISTGVAVAIPENYEGQVRPRSGLALKHGITVLNSPGTIDSDYRGIIQVILINLGELPYTIQPKERIAQLVIAPVVRACFVASSQLSQTTRQNNGFGSTGHL